MTEAEVAALRGQYFSGRKNALLALKRKRQPTSDDAAAFLLRWASSTERPAAFLEVFNIVFAPRADAGEHFWRWIMGEWQGFDRIPHAQYELLFQQYRGAWSAQYMPEKARELYDALPAPFYGISGAECEETRIVLDARPPNGRRICAWPPRRIQLRSGGTRMHAGKVRRGANLHRAQRGGSRAVP